MKLTIIKY
ncbi:hypothetical protein CGLO_18407 [Colletotrichum gloeosporioides Cg-14]|uniref:Uncharacterized protein n=1 Tax=Colletotrichum gloeosporioides (strain Cg-14) TaxID=1237896 RepID=T0L4B5_COLGC|nr:hypothetical protein CGLO_18407 [Colletotrichum gloeosporioides Cg-14]